MRARAWIVGAALALALAAEPAAAAELGGFSSVAGRTLSSVRWSGSGPLAAGELEASTGWRAGAVLDAARWQALGEGVARAGSARGRLDARVARVTFEEDGARVRAEVSIDAGPAYRVGHVGLFGVPPADSAQAARWLGVATGEAWSDERLSAGLERLVTELGARGKPFAQARIRRLAARGGVADVDIAVAEGDSARVDSVRVDGPSRTRPAIVRRALAGLAGAPYDPRRADEARARLVHLGTFASVGEPRFEMTGPGRGLLRYPVAEGGGSSFEGVLGYQGEGGSVAGTARLTLDNIAGTARSAALSWQGRGSGSADFRFAYREPFLFGLPVGAGLSFAQELADTTYTRTDYGVSAEMAAGEGLALELGVGGVRVVTENGDVRRSNRQRTWAALTRESEGWRADGESGRRRASRLEIRTAQEFLHDHLADGSEARDRATELTARAAMGTPWSGRVVRARLEGGLRLGASRELGVYDLFPIGGAESLRGYRERQFRAARYGLVRLEHGWRLGDGDVFVFADQALFGREALSDSTAGTKTRYRAGYGFGAWLPTAVGRAGLSLGWGRGDGPRDAKVHLTLQSRF